MIKDMKRVSFLVRELTVTDKKGKVSVLPLSLMQAEISGHDTWPCISNVIGEKFYSVRLRRYDAELPGTIYLNRMHLRSLPDTSSGEDYEVVSIDM